jgi:hypothetical protein
LATYIRLCDPDKRLVVGRTRLLFIFPMTDWNLITTIQTGAALVQALAACVFLYGVLRDARLRARARREAIVEKLLFRWNLTPDAPTPAERSGFPLSKRQIDEFNKILAAAGESWRVPLR